MAVEQHADLLVVKPGPYDFLNIDVEGVNGELALACPLDQIGARLVCVENEFAGHGAEVLARFRRAGYLAPVQIGGNLLFARADG